MEITKWITKELLWQNAKGDVEYAYFTDEMLDEYLAIREVMFDAEGDPKSLISLRYCDGELVAEFEIYYGAPLSPIQSYRIVQDVLSFHKGVLMDDFLEIICNIFCKTGVTSNDHGSEEARRKLIADVKSFFARIHEVRN